MDLKPAISDVAQVNTSTDIFLTYNRIINELQIHEKKFKYALNNPQYNLFRQKTTQSSIHICQQYQVDNY